MLTVVDGGLVRHQQHPQAVAEAVLGDAFDRGGLRDACRQAGGAGLEGQEGGEQQRAQWAR